MNEQYTLDQIGLQAPTNARDDSERPVEDAGAPRFVVVGSGELIQLLHAGVIRRPDDRWSLTPPSGGVELSPVDASGVAARIARLSLPKGRSSVIVLECDETAESNAVGLSISQVRAIHMTDERAWRKERARFLQGTCWTLGAVDLRYGTDFLAAAPAELAPVQGDVPARPQRPCDRIDRVTGGLLAFLDRLGDEGNIELIREMSVEPTELPREVNRYMCGCLGLELDGVEARAMQILVDTVLDEHCGAVDDRITRFHQARDEAGIAASGRFTDRYLRDVLAARVGQPWSELDDESELAAKALLVASLEPDVFRLHDFLSRASDAVPGKHVGALAMFVVGATVGIMKVPKRSLGRDARVIERIGELARRMLAAEPDPARNELIEKVRRLLGAQVERLTPSGFQVRCGITRYSAEIERGRACSRLILSTECEAPRRLSQATIKRLFMEVVPGLGCRVSGVPGRPRVIRLECRLVIGSIDDPEVDIAFQDLEDGLVACRAVLD